MYFLVLHIKSLEIMKNLLKTSTTCIQFIGSNIIFYWKISELFGKMTHSKSSEGIVQGAPGKFLVITESKKAIINTKIMSKVFGSQLMFTLTEDGKIQISKGIMPVIYYDTSLLNHDIIMIILKRQKPHWSPLYVKTPTHPFFKK